MLKLKYTKDEVHQLNQELHKVMNEAKEDYKRKKKLKGEKLDYLKMRNTINQRKAIKIASKRALAGIFSLGNILDKPAINRASEKLEREAINLESKRKEQI